MKTPQRLLCCALAVMLSSTGWARIGETLIECLDRYGDVNQEAKGVIDIPGVKVVNFIKSGMIISIAFWEEKASMIVYQKEEQNFGIPAKLSEAEIETLLDANAVDGTWKKIDALSAGFGNEGWISQNRRVKAQYRTLKPALTIGTTEFEGVIEADGKAKDKKNLEGF